MKKRLISILLTLVLVLTLMPAVRVEADDPFSGIKNTTTVVHFDDKDWYLIPNNDDDNTVTLLTKECVAASAYNENHYFVDYSNSTIKTAVDTYYNGSISAGAKAAVSGGGMFLLTADQASMIDIDVRKCQQYSDPNYWWLCSPHDGSTYQAKAVDSDYGYYDADMPVDMVLGVRPALKLNLEKVVFDSGSKTFSLKTTLGTGAMANPSEPANKDTPWRGSYVYYGSYSGQPVKYRVLAHSTSRFGGNTMFLDCDTVLFDHKFRNDYEAADANQWSASDVRTKLNNAEDADSFLNKGFNAVERAAIAESTIVEHEFADFVTGKAKSWFGRTHVEDDKKYYTPLEGDRIFLLDVEDVLNTAYGYSDNCGFPESGTPLYEIVDNHKKSGSTYWSLRSPESDDSSGVALVEEKGCVGGGYVEFGRGVSPAFNINLSSVIFSSLVSGTSGQAGAEYKLTLKDPGLTIVAGAVPVEGIPNKYLIPYDITDNSDSADPTQVSVVVTDKPWTENGWSENTTLLQYTKLDGLSGTGTFTLDSSITGTWGIDFHVYVLAEDVNAGNATDYASAPLEIAPTSYLLKFDAYDGIGLMASMNVCDNDMFTFPACEFTAPAGKPFDHWEMSGVNGLFYPDKPGQNEVKITSSCADSYGLITVTAKWKDLPAATVTTLPTAKDLTYTGSAQDLVTAGSASNGTMQYAIGTNATTSPTTGWSETIPKETAAGTYYVWYRAKGDGTTYLDSTPEYVTVTIKSSSGGGSGGGYTPTPPTPPKPPTPPTPVEKYTTPSTSENSIKVSAEIKNGTATLGEIKAEDIKKITDALGDKSENATLLIDLSGAKSEVNSLVLSTATMEVLAKAIEGNENLESVTIKLSNAEVVIDGLALVEIAKQAKGDSIKLVVEEAKDLSTAQKEALSDYDAVSVFSVYFESDGTMIHDFNGGTVILSVKFEPEDGRDPKHYHIYYLSGLGDMTRHLTRWIKGFLQFLTGHCSDFVIVYDEKLENETSKGDDWTETEYLPNGVTKDEDGSYSFYDPDLGTVPLSEEVLTGGLVHRMYNPNSGEHFYTVSDEERDILISAGWIYESEDGFTGPAASEDTLPVYRLYNPNGNDHHFTLDRDEAIGLKEAGWIYEGVVFYAYDSRNGIPVYRVYNPNSGHHFFTTDKKEFDFLVTLGWIYEGIAWYAVTDSI